ncbi:MAG: hypothetical protein IT371_02795 [Deltaproteobacteria bacterium]|nr:hypothetical protein [Deltaproteobacteria bacterium]
MNGRHSPWVYALVAAPLLLSACGRTPSLGGTSDGGTSDGGTSEVCGNQTDDDGDGLVDCRDPDCLGQPGCNEPPRPEVCGNGLDDDGDGRVDCKDPDCAAEPGCAGLFELCANRQDDDGDGLVDCADLDCVLDPACKPTTEDCNNRLDDDGDGLVDCRDPDCAGTPACPAGPEQCTNQQDDDGDGAIDCDDSDCRGNPACAPGQENCSNQQDDDGDGLVDCRDPDCLRHPKCKQPGAEVCNNGLDDDEDGLTDCKDSDCAAQPFCRPGKEICDNSRDDDGDGAVDCADPDCVGTTGCQSQGCKPTVDFGSIAPRGASVARSLRTVGGTDVYASTCAAAGGGEVVGRFLLTAKTDLKISFEQQAGDHVLALYRAGVGEACNANSRGCFDTKSEKTGSFSVKGLEAGEYYLLAEAFSRGLEGTVLVTLSTGQLATPEHCSNAQDDDGDGAVDCSDLDCTFDAACVNQSCRWDANLGTLVIDGPAKTVTVTTVGGGDDQSLVCAAGGGHDRVIRVVMPAAGGIAVEAQQQGWHVFGMHRDLGPGSSCTADSGTCFDSNHRPGFLVSYDSVERGVYYYVVDAIRPGSEGSVRLTFRAYRNRGPELCGNQIDDDGDGLIDCLDSDCTGVLGCAGPVCTVDQRVGQLPPGGAPRTVKLDLTKANNDQTVPCALGGGKDSVIEVDLPQVSGLQVSCSQTGDHVIGLFLPGKPRDPCDKTPINCADMQTGPLGCNFIFPNLQPGKYYVIVEGFKSGSEGTMNLTLSATPDHAQEICNNKVDDDGDGKIDCQDSNCSSKPICQGQTCKPDQVVGMIPFAGAPRNVAVTTKGSVDDQATGCALGGGEDSVVSLALPMKGDVTVDFAQFGNHVLALYKDGGPGFACDAAPVACQTTAGQPVGKVVFKGVQAGQYFLVVDAAAKGSEGSVVMQLSGR